MFAWICPQCGKDVPPSMTECPNCAMNARSAATSTSAPTAVPAGGPPPAWQPPVPPPPPPPVYHTQQFAPPPPQYAQPPYPPQQYPAQQYPAQYAQQPPSSWPPPAQRSGPPAWLITVASTLGFLVILGGIYYMISGSGNSGTSSAKSATTAAASPDTSKKPANPLQSQIEITGLRFVTENKAPAIRFIVVNHSGADIADLAGSVTLSAGTSKSDEDSIGTFRLTLDNIRAGEIKEMTAPLKTKLKAYELPDWQKASADVQITSPAP